MTKEELLVIPSRLTRAYIEVDIPLEKYSEPLYQEKAMRYDQLGISKPSNYFV